MLETHTHILFLIFCWGRIDLFSLGVIITAMWHFRENIAAELSFSIVSFWKIFLCLHGLIPSWSCAARDVCFSYVFYVCCVYILLYLGYCGLFVLDKWGLNCTLMYFNSSTVDIMILMLTDALILINPAVTKHHGHVYFLEEWYMGLWFVFWRRQIMTKTLTIMTKTVIIRNNFVISR